MEQKPSFLKPAMNYGALLGLAFIVVDLFGYLMGMTGKLNFISYIILAVGLYIIGKNFRDSALGGFITYGESFKLGFMSVLFSSIILGFYTYVFLAFIDYSVIDAQMTEAYNMYIDMGMSEEEASNMMKQASSMMTPGFMSAGAFFGMLVIGSIVSLITSAFIKKEDTSTMPQ